MKTTLLFFCLLVLRSPLNAQTGPDPGEVTRPFVQAMDHYGALQAVHIDELVFRRDPQAKAFILAGQGHIHNSGNTLYRDFFRPLGRTTPAILVDEQGGLAWVDQGRDVFIFTPPTQTVHGRPHWLLENGTRKAVPVPVDRPVIVKAYHAAEASEQPKDGRLLVPAADQLVIEAIDRETAYNLILRPGRYVIQYWSPEGVLIGQQNKEVE